MSDVDIYLVGIKHPPNFTQDGGTRHLYAIGLQNRINVVGVDGVIINDTILGSTCKFPDATEIGPIGSKLYSSSLKHVQTNGRTTNLGFPLFTFESKAIHNAGDLTNDSLTTGALYDPDQEKFWEIGRKLDRWLHDHLHGVTQILTSSLNEHADTENWKFEA